MEFEEFLTTHMSEINAEFLNSRSSEQQALFTEVYGLIRQYFPMCDCYTTHNAKEKKRFFKFGVKDGSGKGKPRISVSFFADTVRVSVNRHFFKERKIIELSSIEELSPFLENIKNQLIGEMDGDQRNPINYSQDEETTEEDATEKRIVNDSCEFEGSVSPLNQILYGPPGTGKTYHTIEAAVKAAEPEKYVEIEIDENLGATKFQRSQLAKLYKQLCDEGRVRFVTFHQSYGYEEFVEGLKARETESGDLTYVTESGIFKSLSDKASEPFVSEDSEINRDGRVWKLSIEGTHENSAKTYCLKNNLGAIGWKHTGDLAGGNRNDYYKSQGRNNQNSLRYFSQDAKPGDLVLCINSNTSVEAVGVITGEYIYNSEGLPTRDDFCHQLPIKWLAKDFSVDFKVLNDNKQFNLPTFYPLSRLNVSNTISHLLENNVEVLTTKIQTNPSNYVLIIDEINRGNISKVFGELITLIEPSKRSGNNKEALYATLPYSGSRFSVPDNLYIIGTMNTADRSLAMMDTALRRRFDFIEMMPQPELFKGKEVKGIDLEQLLETMNKRIEVLYDREHTLGHAFLIPVLDALNVGGDNAQNNAFSELKNTFKNKIIPLLEEYFFEDWNKIRLVLGDNRKEKSELEQYIFVKSKNEEYTKIFGKNHGLETYEDTKTTYTLADFNAQDSVWNSPIAYQAIYDDTLLKSPANIIDDADEVTSSSAQ
ncbi:MAG: AAA family ATPase [Pseudoalteromonas sp.]|uniref:AAA family ATPase n=1 Tax=Pseudoalteromonas sp. TaxID=53249 RepID=UPI000EE7D296|nr:AAA family ATPase [Pseudoalteromonas sp.]MCH2088688.1 AAA family ATPase [Pseudoalteromonas sp.]HCV04538.1 AAA family ATPase [Pseudoalteromonas sp.]|tara:strand:- start:10892 stop:13021 length:2130 start_codon:yes stop_codon:yes gene_type:complete